MELQERMADGFVFEDEIQAAEARNDMERIGQLEKKLNYDNLDAVAMVYIKGVQNDLFGTTVGYAYLKRLQLYLMQKEYQKIDFDKYPILVHARKQSGRTLDDDRGQKEEAVKLRVRTNYQQELKKKLGTSIWINVILTLAIIALFVITMMGENANIINYRYNIENRYSQWQTQLEEREAAVREKEHKLHMDEE